MEKAVLVPGCGEGVDAIRMSKAGAHAHAFDISPDMVRVAEERAAEEAAAVDIRQMAAERLTYGDDTFDVIFLHDVLHHCDLDKCLEELVRVAKRDAFVIIDELYTHDILQRIRESKLGCWLHSKVAPYIYPTGDAYITEDERKLTNRDLKAIKRTMYSVQCDYFNIVVGRFVPEWTALAIGDRSFLKLLGPAGYFCAGRFVLSGRIKKTGNCG